VEPVKPAAGQPHLDRARAESDRRELAPGNDAMLRAGYVRDAGISRTDLQFPFTMNGNSRFAGHALDTGNRKRTAGSRT
jgi:hypothetical protein